MGNYVHRIARLYDINADRQRRQFRTRLPVFQEEDYDDESFFKRFLFTKNVMDFLDGDLPEAVNMRGLPIAPRTQLLVALRYYATGSLQIVHGDLQGVSQPSASRIVKNVSKAIARHRGEEIRFPINQDAVKSKLKFYEMHGFPDVLGCIDGVHIPIQAPRLEEKEIYRCRKGFMSLNVQGIADAQMKFVNIVNRWLGSTHDSRIFDNSRLCFQFEQGDFNGLLLGDKGYPCRPFLMTPFRNPNGAPQNAYDRSHKRTRSVVERMFGLWKRKFPCLTQGIRVKLDTAMAVITVTVVLHNIAMDLNEPDFGEESGGEADDVPAVNRDEEMGEVVRQRIVQYWFQ